MTKRFAEFWLFVALLAVALALPGAALAQEARPGPVSFGAGSTVDADDLAALGNFNIRLWEPSPGVELVASVGGTLWEDEGAQSTYSWNGGPGFSFWRAATVGYGRDGKAKEWRWFILGDVKKINALLTGMAQPEPAPQARVAPEMRALHASINQVPRGVF